tara:strand:+ start:99 stop:587 length:489 start_codon:yes stop_codon:yes gene_type:complete
MTLNELKKMVAEEYSRYLAEQADPMGMVGPMGGPGAAPLSGPGVSVTPGKDIDLMDGGADAESTLKDIFNMLKDYFEGEEGMTPETPSDLGDDLPTDKPAAPKAPKAPKPAAPKPAPKSTPKPDAKDDAKKDDKKDDDKEDKKDDKDELKERFKKLANIIKG